MDIRKHAIKVLVGQVLLALLLCQVARASDALDFLQLSLPADSEQQRFAKAVFFCIETGQLEKAERLLHHLEHQDCRRLASAFLFVLKGDPEQSFNYLSKLAESHPSNTRVTDYWCQLASATDSNELKFTAMAASVRSQINREMLDETQPTFACSIEPEVSKLFSRYESLHILEPGRSKLLHWISHKYLPSNGPRIRITATELGPNLPHHRYSSDRTQAEIVVDPIGPKQFSEDRLLHVVFELLNTENERRFRCVNLDIAAGRLSRREFCRAVAEIEHDTVFRPLNTTWKGR
ncbi:MAG: hypothetical protein AAFV88_25070, partial [Planctomycetota bacterium]